MIEGVHVSFYPDDIGTATLILQELLKRTDNVGIGLMQVNYFYHIKRTDVDPVTLFDHSRNLDMGCRILGHAIDASPTLWEGIGRYHSYTSWRARQYAIRVLKRASTGIHHD